MIETPAAERFRPGDVAYAMPAHICPTTALHQFAYVVENGAGRGPVGDRGAGPGADAFSRLQAVASATPQAADPQAGRARIMPHSLTPSQNPDHPMDDSNAADPLKPKYHRVLLKLSGEASRPAARAASTSTKRSTSPTRPSASTSRGVQLAIVVGAGNILRGAQFCAGGTVIKEATAHYMGMLATVLNGMALQSALESIDCETRLMTAHAHGDRRRAVHPAPGHAAPGEGAHRHPRGRHRQPVRHDRHRRRVAGPRAGSRTSSSRRPRWTASTAKIRRSIRTPCAIEKLTHAQVIRDNLRVMDTAAIDLCRARSCRSWCSISRRKATSSGPSPGIRSARSWNDNEAQRVADPCEPSGGALMTSDEILFDAEERMEKALERVPRRVARPAHRPGDAGAGRSPARRILRLADAAQDSWRRSTAPIRSRSSSGRSTRAASRTSRRRSAPATWAWRRTTTAR